ncbi:hypothetical protein [Streptomyces sp. NPDC002758]
MRITHTTAAMVAAHLGALTHERVSVHVGTGRDGRGYRVTVSASPLARTLTWDSARNEGRQAVAYMLGAVDAYTDGEAFDRTPFLADLRRVLAWRPELSGALDMGREDGTAARVQSGQTTAPKEAARVTVEFAPDEETPTGEDLDRDNARDGLLSEWDHTGTAYPYVTVGMAWEVKRYALVYDVDVPNLDDRDAVGAFVDAARTA